MNDQEKNQFGQSLIGNYYERENGQRIILYSFTTNDFPELEKVGLKKLGKLEKPFYTEENKYLPIFSLNLFLEAINPLTRVRNRDKALSEAHVESWNSLSTEYVLIKYCKSKLSRKLREYVLDKYIELNDSIIL